MKLVIVESPTKCKTIGKYLGEDYEVVASKGHIRDLSISGEGGLGVDVKNNFAPKYVINKDKKKVVAELKKLASKADEVILATDPDREGEAIAWHLAEVLGLDVKTTKRLEFHEITKSAIVKALENPRIIDMNLVASQETRRIIDRLMGFKLSMLLKKKIKSPSAGRVQSVTLKLITDREKEINEFVAEEYWSIDGVFGKDLLKSSLATYKDEKVSIKNEDEANKILKDLPTQFIINSIKKSKRVKESKFPFTTSTMQQESFNKFKYSTKKTQSIAQKLYEGVEIDGIPQGLITYMRTDSTRFSADFVYAADKFIEDKYGKNYVGFEKKAKDKQNIQDAHEAIRPTNLSYEPNSIKQYLTKEQYNLYSLIFNRALASLMSAKIDEITSVELLGNDYKFNLQGVKPVFDGYSKIYNDIDIENPENILPELIKGEMIDLKDIKANQHFTKAPARYSEAKLVKTMEELGIGRPSTYASTIELLGARDYAKSEKGYLKPSEQGIITVENLSKYFTQFMDTSYTANMENSLDAIVEGNNSRNELLKTFYDELVKLVDFADKNMEKAKPVETGELCPTCGSPLVKRKGRYGEFTACSNYPTCSYVKKDENKVPAVETGEICPNCGKPLVMRTSKKGEHFIACSGFPKCRFIKNSEEKKKVSSSKDGTECPKCHEGHLVIKSSRYGSFLGCSNFPKCKYIEKIEKEVKDDKD